ncbi:FAD-dependent oxidoreductase [Streptomyces albireticuli]|uniref:FAD-dependent oxidoreductase n=1 Tax=Streptomyces albireticuli TaxID=1940 RepID=UPI001E31E28E|nr:FAD-dependent oxidoreductase [Streptomyces albireticuli]MCD9143584.1 FAD-dependent oxidoreductase [Streptomyces albireticuli]MCD9161985.1 FAD-dependent oxidoreductase [Streptomyces albireticuli]MCD9191701.1 FAD-dependent oxidoreductase [Streptomyces albireticuli]
MEATCPGSHAATPVTGRARVQQAEAAGPVGTGEAAGRAGVPAAARAPGPGALRDAGAVTGPRNGPRAAGPTGPGTARNPAATATTPAREHPGAPGPRARHGTCPGARTGILVIGGGTAAHRLVQRLHELGHPGPVTLLGAEPGPAYHRPLLTSVLGGGLCPADLVLPPLPEGTVVRTGTTAVAVDRWRRVVRTDDGGEYAYATLVLATGARPREPLEGAGVLRTLDDCARLGPGHVTVVGGGVLGVETAAALRRAGRRVTLAHPGPYPMADRLPAAAGRLLAARLARLGVEAEPDAEITGREHGKLRLRDGRLLDADTVLQCAGVTPDTALARAAGLTVRTGVVVDDALRTSDPYVRALGDCAEHPGAAPGTHANAWDQAEALAGLLATGRGRYRGTRYVVRPRVPGLDLVTMGRAHEDDQRVAFSDPARGRFAELSLRNGMLTSATLVGLPRAIAAVTQLHDHGLPVPADRLALLLGTAPAEAGPVELPDEAVVCRCNNVTKAALTAAIRAGARDLPALATATRATTGCGSCTPTVRALCTEVRTP